MVVLPSVFLQLFAPARARPARQVLALLEDAPYRVVNRALALRARSEQVHPHDPALLERMVSARVRLPARQRVKVLAHPDYARGRREVKTVAADLRLAEQDAEPGRALVPERLARQVALLGALRAVQLEQGPAALFD